MNSKRTHRGFTRREALKAGVAVVAPMILPSRLCGQDAPSNKITLGVIGTGGKGTGGMRNFMGNPSAQVVAVCDVNKKHRDRAGDMAKVPAARRYNDFRELLARDDIDAVLVASPDHWHILQSKAAEAVATVQGHGRKRLVLSSGCTLAPDTPVANVEAMVDLHGGS